MGGDDARAGSPSHQGEGADARARGPGHRGAAGRRAVPGLSKAVEVGKLVFLRPPTDKDRAEFVALRRGSRKFLERWEPIPRAGIDPYGDTGFDLEMELRETARTRRFLVCRKADGVIVGRLSMSGIERGIQQSCHFGYWMGVAYTGKGYMSEAVRLGLRHAFNTLKLHRVEANMQPTNEASRRVVIAAGLKQEGYSPKYLKIRGRWADHERWAVTREVWRMGRGGEMANGKSQMAK